MNDFEKPQTSQPHTLIKAEPQVHNLSLCPWDHCMTLEHVCTLQNLWVIKIAPQSSLKNFCRSASCDHNNNIGPNRGNVCGGSLWVIWAQAFLAESITIHRLRLTYHWSSPKLVSSLILLFLSHLCLVC